MTCLQWEGVLTGRIFESASRQALLACLLSTITTSSQRLGAEVRRMVIAYVYDRDATVGSCQTSSDAVARVSQTDHIETSCTACQCPETALSGADER